jgi:hypothetical protein
MKKIFFGTGLASSKEESCGFGFELLNPVLTALALAKKIEADGILHEIGTVGYKISSGQRKKLIEEQLNLVINMAQNLNIEGYYKVKLSHSYHQNQLFKNIFQEVEHKMSLFENLPNFQKYGSYTVIQISQMKYLYCTENASIKVGWLVGDKPVIDNVSKDIAEGLINRGKLNEFYFDSIYRYVFPADRFSFEYTTAGMDLLDGKKYAPYTVTKSQNRPLLIEPIKEFLSKIPDSKHKREALKNYKKSIVDNWEILFGEIDAFDYISIDEKLTSKLQFIQERVLGAKAL